MEEGRAEELKMPELEEILQLRDNQEGHDAYCYYLYHFLPYIVGKHKWRKEFNRSAVFDNLYTASDEAFGLLVLENNWDRWKWEAERTKEEIEAQKEDRPDVKYTTGKGGAARKHQGWNGKGLRRYNELGELVTNDRKEWDSDNKWDDIFYPTCEKFMKGGKNNNRSDGNDDEDGKNVTAWTCGFLEV